MTVSHALPVLIDLDAYRGDTWAQSFRLIADDAPVDLTGATLAAWARRYDDELEVMLVSSNGTPGELTLMQPAGGLEAGKWRYDVEVRDAGAVITTWIRGTLTVAADITNAPSS